MHVIRSRSRKRKPFYEAVGWLGMVLILGAFILLSTGVLDGEDWEYFLVSLLGSIGLFLNSYAHDAKPPALLNILYAAFAVYGLWRILA